MVRKAGKLQRRRLLFSLLPCHVTSTVHMNQNGGVGVRLISQVFRLKINLLTMSELIIHELDMKEQHFSNFLRNVWRSEGVRKQTLCCSWKKVKIILDTVCFSNRGVIRSLS